jgi:hypothetical protein
LRAARKKGSREAAKKKSREVFDNLLSPGLSRRSINPVQGNLLKSVLISVDAQLGAAFSFAASLLCGFA